MSFMKRRAPVAQLWGFDTKYIPVGKKQAFLLLTRIHCDSAGAERTKEDTGLLGILHMWGWPLSLFGCSVMSDSLRPHGLQHIRLPYSSLSPRVCSNSASPGFVMPSNHLILCHPLLMPSVFPPGDGTPGRRAVSTTMSPPATSWKNTTLTWMAGSGCPAWKSKRGLSLKHMWNSPGSGRSEAGKDEISGDDLTESPNNWQFVLSQGRRAGLWEPLTYLSSQEPPGPWLAGAPDH